MRKAIFALLSLSLCLSLAAPALAQQEQVVPELAGRGATSRH